MPEPETMVVYNDDGSYKETLIACACGCGEMVPLRPHYFSASCRTRAWRERQ